MKLYMMPWVLLSLFLFVSPFVIGGLIFYFLAPSGFWQSLVTLVIALLICFFEGFMAWLVGLAILSGVLR